MGATPRLKEAVMAGKTVRIPGPDHPITITPTDGRVVVTVQEANYPAVQYVPLADVTPGALERTATGTWCPYKGDAGYYSIPAGGATATDAVWEYAEPHDAVAQIKGHVAFYPDRVDSIDIKS
jgi:uncharacterized protein (DUF427 family)